MRVANSESVLGDFDDVSIPYFDTSARFSVRNGRYFADVQDSTGEQKEFEVTHTFGVSPLQQYLVEVPGGRKQALQFAWDTRASEVGGQRWYHLYQDEYVGPGDPLHWTGRYFNWNFTCAECHSTNVKLGYSVKSDTFDTTFSEISVGCEACHGPGSLHIEQAASDSFDAAWGLDVDLDDRSGAVWVMSPETGIAERSGPTTTRQQPEACGRCHARRSVIATDYEYGAPLTDTHMPSLLEENLYHADGRIQDEVYVYGSFLQSKMYAAGVTCSDCHNPHSGELHAGPDPNDTCATCHLSEKFATSQHSEVIVGNCVDCHMPATTYMGVDPRRDHSFRIPSAGEADMHYGKVIAGGRAGSSNDALLNGADNRDFPTIARGTMLSLLEPIQDSTDQAALLEHLDDPDPLVRIGTLRALRGQDADVRMRSGGHLLRDPIRAVRIEAVLTYVDFRDLLPIENARAFAKAADEYRDSMLESASMPTASLNLAEFESRLGNSAAASTLYEHAFKIGAYSGAVQHAYGLHLVRSGKQIAALEHLRRATELEPGVERFIYVYGVALNSLGYVDAAISTLRDARLQFPSSIEIGWALATILRDSGKAEAARTVVQEILVGYPDDPDLNTLLNSL